MTRISNLSYADTVLPTDVLVVSDGQITRRVSIADFKEKVLTQATREALGTVKVGIGLEINDAGVLSVRNYSGFILQPASADRLGGIKVGFGLEVSETGVLSSSYEVPVSSPTQLGGVIVGDGLAITGDGVLSVVTIDRTKFDNTGIHVGAASDIRILVDSNVSVIKDTRNGILDISVYDENMPDESSNIRFVSSTYAHSLGGQVRSALIPDVEGESIDLGVPNNPWHSVYATEFFGELTGDVFGNTSGIHTGNVNANDGSTAYNSFSKRFFGNLTGDVAGNASSANKLETARTINGVMFDGSQDIQIVDSTKLPLAGGTMSGFINLHLDPTLESHPTTKRYVDNRLDSKISTTGGTMTGFLTINDPPQLELHAANKRYVDSVFNTAVAKSGSVMTGLLTLSGDPVQVNHAATKQYVDLTADNKIAANNVLQKQYIDSRDDTRVPLAGGTMTGFLTLSANPTANLHAATKAYVDTSITSAVDNSTSAITSYVDSRDNTRVPLSGGTMTGFLTLSANPTANLHAATKGYVDTSTSGLRDDAVLIAGSTMTGSLRIRNNYLTFLNSTGSAELVKIGGSGNVATEPDIKINANALFATDNHMYLMTDSNNSGVGNFRVTKGSNRIDGSETNLFTVFNNGKIQSGIDATTYANTLVGDNRDIPNKKYVDDKDATRVAKSGDSMSGHLTLNADPISDLHAATKKYVDELMAQATSMPIGSTMFFAATSVPEGWVECNGATYNVNDYPLLFKAIGYRFGGSGSSFRVPDLRGEFLRGWDNGRGIDPGRTFGALQESQFKSHTHTAADINISATTSLAGAHTHSITDPGHRHDLLGNDLGTATNQLFAPGLYKDDAERVATDADTIALASTGISINSVAAHSHTLSAVGSVSINSSGGSDTYPRNVALMICIKAYGNIESNILTSEEVLNLIDAKVKKAGDTMSGFLTLHSNPTANMHAATKGYVDTSITTALGQLQYFDVFTTNSKSPLPTSFPSRSLRGFDAYSSTDFPGSFFSGITVTGPSGVRSAQLAFNWNSEETAPLGVYFRTNDDTSTISEWSPWTQIATLGIVEREVSDLSRILSTNIGNRVAKTGDTMSGFLTLHSNPTANMHAATKQYVDTTRPSNVFASYGSTTVAYYSSSTFFDIFPPSGYTMSNLMAFMPAYASQQNNTWYWWYYYSYYYNYNSGDITWSALSDRIRVYISNDYYYYYYYYYNNQRINWMAIWRK
jgi:microcystin-dependent protein